MENSAKHMIGMNLQVFLQMYRWRTNHLNVSENGYHKIVRIVGQVRFSHHAKIVISIMITCAHTHQNFQTLNQLDSAIKIILKYNPFDSIFNE